MFEFLQSISDWLQQGIYTFFQDAAAYFLTTLLIWYWKAKLAGLTFAWGVAKAMFDSLNMSATIMSFWGGLPAEVSGAAMFFKVPQAVNMLLTAFGTRFVLRFLPF